MNEQEFRTSLFNLRRGIVETLCIRGRFLFHEEALLLSESIKMDHRLTTVNFGCECDKDSFFEIIKSVKDHPSITQLHLYDNALDDSDLLKILSILENNQYLKFIDLSSNSITKEVWPQLFEFRSLNKELVIELSDNQDYDDAFNKAEYIIRENFAICPQKLEFCNICDGDTEIIKDLVMKQDYKNKDVEIYIDAPDLTLTGLNMLLSSWDIQNDKLFKITITDSELVSKYFFYSSLRDIIEDSRSLREFHLEKVDFCKLKCSEFKDFAYLLARSQSLEALSLQNCNLTNKMINILIEALNESVSKIQRIDLSGNPELKDSFLKDLHLPHKVDVILDEKEECKTGFLKKLFSSSTASITFASLIGFNILMIIFLFILLGKL